MDQPKDPGIGKSILAIVARFIAFIVGGAVGIAALYIASLLIPLDWADSATDFWLKNGLIIFITIAIIAGVRWCCRSLKRGVLVSGLAGAVIAAGTAWAIIVFYMLFRPLDQ